MTEARRRFSSCRRFWRLLAASSKHRDFGGSFLPYQGAPLAEPVMQILAGQQLHDHDEKTSMLEQLDEIRFATTARSRAVSTGASLEVAPKPPPS